MEPAQIWRRWIVASVSCADTAGLWLLAVCGVAGMR